MAILLALLDPFSLPPSVKTLNMPTAVTRVPGAILPHRLRSTAIKMVRGSSPVGMSSGRSCTTILVEKLHLGTPMICTLVGSNTERSYSCGTSNPFGNGERLHHAISGTWRAGPGVVCAWSYSRGFKLRSLIILVRLWLKNPGHPGLIQSSYFATRHHDYKLCWQTAQS